MPRGRLTLFVFVISSILFVMGKQSGAGEFVFEPVPDYSAKVDPDTIPVSEGMSRTMLKSIGPTPPG